MRSAWIPCAVILGFVLCLAAYVTLSTPRAQHVPSDETLQLREAEEGIAIVEAIYRYHNRCDLWPTELQDLIPEFATADEVVPWRYQWFHKGRWTITNYKSFPSYAVQYVHPEKGEATWKVTWGEDEKPLAVVQPIPQRTALEVEERERQRVKEMLRRIAKKPREMIHYQGLTWWLYERRALGEARKVCQKCIECCPDRWWPMLMRGLIDCEMGEADRAERDFRAWVERDPDFNRFFFLAYLYGASAHVDKVCDALASASELPVTDIRVGVDWKEVGDENYSGQAIAWFAGVTAYRHRKFAVAHKICDQWEKCWHDKSGNPNDASFYVLRAACFLSEGEMDAAQAQVDLAKQVDPRGRMWAWKVREQVERAILERNSMYTYDPEKDGSDDRFTMSVEYQ